MALILAAALLVPSLADAADPAAAAASTERRLTPEQVRQVLEEAARKREGAGTLADPSASESGRLQVPVHGEVGFAIGTGGYRSAYGTAIVGLPGDGTAMLSVGTQRLPNNHFYPFR